MTQEIDYAKIGRESDAYKTTVACFKLEGIELGDDELLAINAGKLVLGEITKEQMLKEVAERLGLEG